MIQSFSIVFAGYKMPACLRPAMSSPSAWCLCRGLSVSGLSPSLAQSDIITLSPISSPLSLLTRHQVWRSLVCCRIGIILSKPWSEDYRGEQHLLPTWSWWLQARNKCQTDFFNPFLCDSPLMRRSVRKSLSVLSEGRDEALTVRNISFKPLQGYNSFNLIVIQHFGYFFSSAGCCGAELSLYYSAHINPVKQETEQLIKGNITLARDPITTLCSKTNNSQPGKCCNRLFNFHKDCTMDTKSENHRQ